ncbi:hypothetical protein ACH5RR_032746 [Cinchona calisaya]|uniref:SET domain-containing protein n=1 Tax=Cinchona calisaya TaxID=153742 RepID=A0ABD2YLF2_9GENT
MDSNSTNSSSIDSAFQAKKLHGEQETDKLGTLTRSVNQLKKQIQAERVVSVREKLEGNRKNVETHFSKLVELASSREDVSISMEHGLGNKLSARMENPLCIVNGHAKGFGERDLFNVEEAVSSATVKLPLVEKIPPYTTWVFLDRNQQMSEDQSVVGRKIIYYDPHGGETLICSDSEEENAQPEEEKHEFSKAEDHIIWMTFMEYGLGEEVLKILIQFVGGTPSEIKERCKVLKEENEARQNQNLKDSEKSVSEECAYLEQNLSAALDTFDNLFCRRCLVFDCRLHGCSQILINSGEKQSYSYISEDEMKPCGEQCYLLSRVIENLPEGLEASSFQISENRTSAEDCRTLITTIAGQPEHDHDSAGKHKVVKPLNAMAELVSDNLLGSGSKKLKSVVQSAVGTAVEDRIILGHSPTALCKDLEFVGTDENQTINDANNKFGSGDKIKQDARKNVKKMPILKEISDSKESSEWKPLEKDLFLKGIEIFGRNSCLIARNLLPGLKTCKEISKYMNDTEAATSGGDAADNGRGNMDHMEEAKMPGARSRLFRKRGRTRRLKFSLKSSGYHPSIWRRIANEKDLPCTQYTPCTCQPQATCGKQCPCLQNGTTCEKYCGYVRPISTSVQRAAKTGLGDVTVQRVNAKAGSVHALLLYGIVTLMFAAIAGCGDGSLGEPPKRGDGQCGNMKLLLRQYQRILLAKSDITGWGAFLKNSVNKNDYLGEYTGELISHQEADKRGKIYDRANSSFLFNLNDQYVLDARFKGDKLKFANHSSNPNCFAKVIFVAGDHRVAIFANENMEAGQEIFYDYNYSPNVAPIWARPPEGSKKEDSSVPQGRAKKHQSQ